MDFLLLTLPAGQQFTAVIGLSAFDGGLVAWSLFYLNGRPNQWQRAIALVMIGVSLTGVVAAFIGDTLYHAAAQGLTAALDPDTITTIVLSMSVVIAANIAAVIAIHLAATPDGAGAPGAATGIDAEPMRITTKAFSENGREPATAQQPVDSPNASSGRRPKTAPPQ